MRYTELRLPEANNFRRNLDASISTWAFDNFKSQTKSFISYWIIKWGVSYSNGKKFSSLVDSLGVAFSVSTFPCKAFITVGTRKACKWGIGPR